MIRVQTEDFDPGAALEQLRVRCAGRAGAVVSFTGLVRDLNDGDPVSLLTLEHYPGMTEKALADIEAAATERWQLVDTVIISAHRKDAFLACEYLIDTLKTEAPFWKQEDTPAGKRWVEAPG
jgi:molybdopterin synthase catalytic subunit